MNASSLPRFLVLVFALLACFSLPLRAEEEAFKLSLTFTGSGTVVSNQTHLENRYNFRTKKNESAIVTDSGRKSFNGSGLIEIIGSNARIKLPSALVPLLNSGNGGWFVVNDLWVNDDEITGIVRINGLNRPKLRIDRNSGTIAISGGFGEFNGQCDVVRPGAPVRKF
ncbi:hypothetical protein Verru16b_00699 [Lacunisphaera limnophila]|uniref:Uncharacterized protein n=1 Tax=Lacunisphaera limnophila TaxID=1838286 RepID=A0A1D8ARZ3_9BACT|nr:hypothetical protein [Lacunisphaera limnophila]AOS43647.1 hypothetical protein Verru16b_00699 [Lacunisphaera limnophila]